MKLRNIKQVNDFLFAVDKCQHEVWLESKEGDKLSLKSPLSQYVAIGALLSERGNELELFCSDSKDEINFYKFFANNPGVL